MITTTARFAARVLSQVVKESGQRRAWPFSRSHARWTSQHRARLGKLAQTEASYQSSSWFCLRAPQSTLLGSRSSLVAWPCCRRVAGAVASPPRHISEGTICSGTLLSTPNASTPCRDGPVPRCGSTYPSGPALAPPSQALLRRRCGHDEADAAVPLSCRSPSASVHERCVASPACDTRSAMPDAWRGIRQLPQPSNRAKRSGACCPCLHQRRVAKHLDLEPE